MHFRICPLMWPSRALPGKTIASCSVWLRRKWDICGWVLTQVRSREFSPEVLWFTHNQEVKVWFRQHWESFPVPPALIDWTLKTDQINYQLVYHALIIINIVTPHHLYFNTHILLLGVVVDENFGNTLMQKHKLYLQLRNFSKVKQWKSNSVFDSS